MPFSGTPISQLDLAGSAPIVDVNIPASGAPADAALPSIAIPDAVKGRVILRANLEFRCNARKNAIAGTGTFGATGGKIYVSSDNGATYPDLALDMSGHGTFPATGNAYGLFSFQGNTDLTTQVQACIAGGWDLAFKFTNAQTSGPGAFDLYDAGLVLHLYVL